MAQIKFEHKREKKSKLSLTRKAICGITAAALAAMLIPVGFWTALADDVEDAQAVQLEQVEAPASEAEPADQEIIEEEPAAGDAQAQEEEDKAPAADKQADEPEAEPIADDEIEKVSIKVKLAQGTLLEGQSSITMRLMEKDGGSWKEAGRMGLTESALSVDGLDEGTYRVEIADENESRLVADRTEVEKDGRETTFDSDEGIAIDASDDGSVIEVSLRDADPATIEEEPAEEPAPEEQEGDEAPEPDGVAGLEGQHSIEEVPAAGGNASASYGYVFSINTSGNGTVTVETNVGTQTISGGDSAVILVPEGQYAHITAHDDGFMPMIGMSVSYEPSTTVSGEEFWRDVTAYASHSINISMGGSFSKAAKIMFGEDASPESAMSAIEDLVTVDSACAATPDPKNPQVGDVFTYTGDVGYVVSVLQPGGAGHSVSGVKFKITTGILKGQTMWGWCASHTAAAPYVGQHFTKYTFVVNEKSSGGMYEGIVTLYPTGATDGHTTNGNGLTGYQWVAASGGVEAPDMARFRVYKSPDVNLSGHTGYYSLAGAKYGIYKTKEDADANRNKIDTLTTDASGKTNKSIELEVGVYWIKEYKAPANFDLDSDAHKKRIDADEAEAGEIDICESTERSHKGRLQIQKSSATPAITNGNDYYSLAGAQYTIYTDAACTIPYQTLTTDAFGKTQESAWLLAGNYYVKETKAPKGYKLDTRVYTVNISVGASTPVNTLQVKDEALNDPAVMVLAKVDSETGQPIARGDASLAGAQYTVRYYAMQIGSDADGKAAYDAITATPTREWVISTNENGYCRLGDQYKVSGSDFYTDATGKVTLPLGTVTIKETKAPEGFLLNEDACYVRHITENGMGAIGMTLNAPTCPEDIVRNGLTITKDLVGGTTSELEGIGFFLTDAGGQRVSWDSDGDGTEDANELYLDAAGTASTSEDALVYGTYTLHEDRGTVPDGVIWYGNAQGSGEDDDVVGTVTVSEDHATHALYIVEVTNYAKPAFDLVKVDGDSLRDNGGSETDADKVEGSEWKLTLVSDDNGNVLEQGIITAKTGADGILRFVDEDGTSLIDRFGTYRIEEVQPAEGYLDCEDSWQDASAEFTISAQTYSKSLEGIVEGDAGDSWTFTMENGHAAITHCKANWREREIEGKKYDQDDGSPVPDTEFVLYKYSGEGVPAEASELDRGKGHGVYVTNPAEGIDEDAWEVVSQGKTDAKGAFITEGLAFGYYCLYEKVPSKYYAEWWESAGSTWDRYYFTCDSTTPARQTQIFRNDKIEIGTTVDKETIKVTSAGFNSLEGQNVNFQNVGKELYRYDVSFSSTSNVRADQYAVIDDFDFNSKGVRLDKLWLPTVTKDTDGSFNVWYKTNKSSKNVTYSTESATSTNPENQMADGTDRISTKGWKLWQANASATSRQELNVSDLGLADGEYVTGLMLEFGSVEVGFGSVASLTYMVYASEELAKGTVIPNTAHSHITRNWNTGDDGEGSGLFDDADDSVQTTVIETFKYDSESGRWYTGTGSMPKTGDWLIWAVAVLAAIAGAAAVFLAATRRRRAAQ